MDLQETMTWLVFKTSFKKVFLWLKEHWQVPFFILWTALVYIFTRRNTDALVDVIEAKRDSYREQLEALRNSHNNEILKRDKLIKNYEETLKTCHSTVGTAILNTSITIVFGFSILVFSKFIPTIYFGIFTGIAMLLAMISVLTLLPKLLLIIKPFKIKND